MDDPRDHPPDKSLHSAQDVRGGEIILNTRRRRLIFLGGLVLFALFALAAAIIAPH